MIKDTLIYPVADTLALNLHEVGGDKVRGAGTRTLSVGGFKFDAELVVVSDLMETHQSSYFAKLYANLWAYFVVKEVAEEVQTWMMFFNSKVVGIHVKDLSQFGGISIEDTILKLKPAIKAVYEFDAKLAVWKKVTNVFDLDDVPEAQSAVHLGSSTEVDAGA